MINIPASLRSVAWLLCVGIGGCFHVVITSGIRRNTHRSAEVERPQDQGRLRSSEKRIERSSTKASASQFHLALAKVVRQSQFPSDFLKSGQPCRCSPCRMGSSRLRHRPLSWMTLRPARCANTCGHRHIPVLGIGGLHSPQCSDCIPSVWRFRRSSFQWSGVALRSCRFHIHLERIPVSP